MKDKLFIKRNLIIFILSIITLICGVSCSIDDTGIMTLQSDKTEHVLVYGQEFVFNDYFSNTSIKIDKKNGDTFFIPIEESMFTEKVDTSSVGEKTLQLLYNETLFNIKYFVKYKVDFIVDGQIFDTQLVLNKNELNLSKTPTKQGYTFISWEQIDGEIQSNVQLNANFSKDVVVPSLTTINAVYGDKLSSINLPSNNFGSWQFVDNENNEVGSVGENLVYVQFVLNNQQIYATDTIKINVSKKTLQFNVQGVEFEYDGTNKIPTYTFDDIDKNLVNVKFNTLSNNTKNVGTYDFEFLIDDANYQGSYVGQFKITKKQVKVEISSQEMVYLTNIPSFTCNVYDKNGVDLSTNLVNEMQLSYNLPTLPVVGEYDVDLVNTNFNNFEIIEIKKGKLTVTKATHNVDVSVNEEKRVFGEIITNEDLISTTSNDIGVWTLKNGNVQIKTPNSFSIDVKFTPNDTNNYNVIEKTLTFDVAKKQVTINVLQNQFTYNANKISLIYSVDGTIDNDFEVIGNLGYVNADSYDICLTLNSEKYQAEKVNTKLVIGKADFVNFEDEQKLLSEVTYNVKSASKLSHINLSMGYSWVDGEQNLLIGENSYNVKYTPSDLNNYNVQIGTLKVKVNKAQSQIEVTGNDNFIYTYNASHQYNFNAKVNNNEQIISISYKYNNAVVDSLTDSGKYIVTITCNESTHYLSQSKVVEIEILQIENSDTIQTQINATYLDKLEEYAHLLPLNNYGVWTWQQETALVGQVGAQIHNAIYTPYSYNQVNYKSRVVQVTFNVQSYKVQIPTLDKQAFTYTGSLITPTIKTSDLYTIENNGGINVGEYNAKLSLKDKNNYVWSNGNFDDVTLTYNITQATNVWSLEPSLSKENWAYGEDLATITKGSASFGEVNLKYVDNELNEYTNMPTNAGNYTAIFTVTATNNYTGLNREIDFVIEKAKVEIPSLNANLFAYTGNLIKPTIKTSDLYTIVNNGGTIVGEYNAKLSLKDKDNYVWSNNTSSDVTLTYSITQATNVWSVEPSLNKVKWTYGEELASVTLGSASFGEVNVKYVDSVLNEYTNMPTNAGNYTAIFTITATENYTGLEKRIKFTIDKIIVEVPNNQFAVYTGNKLQANISDTSIYQVIENNGGVDVGDYQVKLKLNNPINYRWQTTDCEVISIIFAIQQNNDNSWLIEPSISGWVYGEQASISSYQSKFGAVTIKYIGTNFTIYESNEQPKNTGTYKAIFTVLETDDYIGLEKVVEFTIQKAEVEIPSLSANSFAYTSSLITPTIKASDLYTIENNGGTIVGEYNAKLSLKDKDNYQWSNGNIDDVTLTYNITQATNVWNEEPSLNKAKWTYGEELASVTLGSASFGEINVKYVDGDLNEYANMPTNAGNYTAIFTVTATNNYTGIEKQINFIIQKAEVEIPSLNANSFAYTGNLITPTIKTSDLYTIENIGGTIVGEYNAKLSLKDKDNYVWSSGNFDDVTLTYNITQATNVWSVEPSLSKENWAYNEELASVTLGSASFGEVNVKYVDSDLNEYANIPTNAGNYTAIFTVTATENYTGINKEIDFVIEKAKVEIPSLNANSFTYTGSLITPTITSSDLYTIENNGGTNVGEYNVTLTLNQPNNYKWADKKDGNVRICIYNITKAVNDWNILPTLSKNVWSYGEQSAVVNLGQAKFGQVVVKYFDSNDNELPQIPTAIGEYKAVFTVNDTSNYSKVESIVQFTINKFQLVLTAPTFIGNEFYDNAIDFNNSVNFESYPSLNRDVLGDFVYTLELGQSIVNGKVNVIVSFVPSDTNNYIAPNYVTATINVKAVASINGVNFASIESALLNAVSGDVVWVKAGNTDFIITNNCEIKQGVTLNIPHTDNSMNANETAELNGVDYASTPTISVTTIITIANNVTLTNKGTIQVAGQLSGGNGGHAYAGHTAGLSAKIVLKQNAKIQNDAGTINLFGLIVEETTNNGSQVIINGGNLSLPYVVRDFRGGSYMYAINNKNTVAFNEFELRNVTSLIIVKNSANVYGYANLYAGDKQNSTKVSLVSTTNNAVIHFNDNNGYLTAKYDIVGGYTGVDTWIDGVMSINIYGGSVANAMSLAVNTGVSTTTITTESVFFPISWRLNVSLYSGNYLMEYQYKLMPGAVFVVGDGANLTINQLAIYDRLTYDTAYANGLNGTPAPYYVMVAETGIERTYNRDNAHFIIKSGGIVTISGFIGGNVTLEDNGTFNYQKSSVKYYCSDCNAYYDTKCTKTKMLFIPHSSTEETTSLITIKSPEGKSVTGSSILATGEVEYLTFNLTINGAQP